MQTSKENQNEKRNFSSDLGDSIELLCALQERGYNPEPLLSCLLHNTPPEAFAESLRTVYIELVEYNVADPEFSGSESYQDDIYLTRKLCETLRDMTVIQPTA